MINFEQIADYLTRTLNGIDFENLKKYGLDKITPHEIYAFNIGLDSANYKKAERVGNNVVRYINADMSIVGDNVKGVGAETYSATIQTRIEFLVPITRNNINLLSAVRNLISDTLQFASQDYTPPDEKGIVYMHIMSYDFLQTGDREQRSEAGDSIILPLYIVHTFIAQGVTSDAYLVEVSLDKEHYSPVKYNKFGMARKTSFDPNVDSASPSFASKNIPTMTSFTINMDLLTRLYEIDTIIREYVMFEKLVSIYVRVTAPVSVGETTFKEYEMIIDTSGVNAEIGLPSTSSITFVERFM